MQRELQYGVDTLTLNRIEELLKDPKILLGVTAIGCTGLAYIGGSLIINSLITGFLMFSSIALLLYHTKDDWPSFLPWMVKNKSIVDSLFFLLSASAFLSLGVTTGIGLAFTAIFTTIALLILTELGIGESDGNGKDSIFSRIKAVFHKVEK